MDGGTRSNQGYEIIEGCTIGNTELVIGHHPKAPNPYVCWYCKGGDNYYWGCYCNGAILKKWTAKSERWYNNKKRRETHGKHQVYRGIQAKHSKLV